MSRYRYFDLSIESELPLRGLQLVDSPTAAWNVSLLPPAGSAEELDWFHTWSSPNGQPIMAAARRDDTIRLHFFGLAGFDVDFRARAITIHPLAACAAETLVHLLLDQVLPRAICHEGRLVLHASAVVLPDGGAVAFSGISGRGKSTLAAAFYRAGHRVLCDDCLLLEERGGGVAAIAASSSIRLWSDSADSLFTGEQQGRLQASPMAHYTNKMVLSPDSRQSAEESSPVPLRALYLLEPPGPLRITEARGMAAIISLLEAQFTLDVADSGAVRRSFGAVQRIAGRAPVFHLAHPRDYALLPGVVEAVVNRKTTTQTASAGGG